VDSWVKVGDDGGQVFARHNIRDRSEMVRLIDARRHLCTLF